MTGLTSEIGITLLQFIHQEENRHPGGTGKLTNILLAIALGTKIVSRGVARAGLLSLLGKTGGKNVQGEEVQKLDEFADEVFADVLGEVGECFSMVSEERESLFPAKDIDAQSKYVIAFDPLDGSSNIDVNVAIGTIWGVYRRKSSTKVVDPSDMSDFLQSGYDQVAAGYTVYGSSTMFVFTTGDGVNGFTLDPTVGEFILTNPKMKIPKTGRTYSCNEGNSELWSKGIREYVSYVRNPKNNADGKPFSQRYVGSLVADFHRTLLKGGVFFYPADAKNKNGKLRLLYECAPMAMIAEQAGGKASDGSQPILNITPTTIHQRTPLFIGSSELVDHVETYIRDFG